MITDEEFERYLTLLDDNISVIILNNALLLEDSKSNIEYFTKTFYKESYGKEPNEIIWVKLNNTPITEFYPSELNLTWLCTYITFYHEFLQNKHKDYDSIFKICLFLTFVLTKVKGINVINGNVYLLENDLEFVQYNLTPFKLSSTTRTI